MQLKKVKLKDIIPPEIPVRSEIEQQGINDLAQSIMEIGLIQPMTIMKKGGKYEVIAGNRRFQALTQLQTLEIECNIIDVPLEKMHQIRLDENYIREDVSECDEAAYLEAIMNQGGFTQAELSDKIGKSPSYVNERLAIMSYIPELLKALKLKQISFSVAREFNRLKNPKQIREILRYAIVGGCTPKLAREWVQEIFAQNEARESDLNSSSEAPNFASFAENAVFQICGFCCEKIDSRQLRPILACPACLESITK